MKRQLILSLVIVFALSLFAPAVASAVNKVATVEVVDNNEKKEEKKAEKKAEVPAEKKADCTTAKSAGDCGAKSEAKADCGAKSGAKTDCCAKKAEK